MKISGFTFVKNALIYDYPIVEAILSILPICDDFVVAVGKSDDNTLELIKYIHPEKIRIVETEWDESMREGGQVLADETDKAFAEMTVQMLTGLFIFKATKWCTKNISLLFRRKWNDIKMTKKLMACSFTMLIFMGLMIMWEQVLIGIHMK